MAFRLRPLPYASLAPYLSKETIEFHYGKHHATNVTNLNKLAEGTRYAAMSLADIIVENKPGPVFNNAAQIWNHTFYWESMSPNGGGEPFGPIKDLINRDFGTFPAFKRLFTEAATTQFGSGWTWLVQNGDGKIGVFSTRNAGNPLTDARKPLLTIDVWEHAYYIDYRNRRAEFVAGWWNVVNWEHANKRLSAKGPFAAMQSSFFL